MKTTTLERDLRVLDLLKDHILSTHQPGVGQGGLQSRDLIEAAEWLVPQSLANAVDYLFRYGKKDGNRGSDLLKAMHCIAMAYAAEHLDSKAPAVINMRMVSHPDFEWTSTPV